MTFCKPQMSWTFTFPKIWMIDSQDFVYRTTVTFCLTIQALIHSGNQMDHKHIVYLYTYKCEPKLQDFLVASTISTWTQRRCSALKIIYTQRQFG